MNRDLPPARARLRRGAALGLVVLTGLAATFAATLYVADVARRQQEERFSLVAAETTEALRVRLEAYIATLRATRGLFLDGREPSQRAFAEYTAAIDVRTYYPGIQGIGWAKLLRPEEVTAHERQVRAAGNAEYRVWPPGPRDVYTAIVYLEPLDWRNQRALGFDMHSEPTRAEAMDRARDTGEPATTARVELVQEAGTERQWGFLIYVPVYAGAPSTPAERRDRLVGWVYAPFRVADLVLSTLGDATTRGLDVELDDAPAPTPSARIFDGNPARRDRSGPTRVARLDVGGRAWTLRVSAAEGFSSWERWGPGAVLAAGLLLTFLLHRVGRAEARALATAEAATRRAAFLAEAGRTLAASLDYARTLQQVADLAAVRVADGCVVYVAEPGAPLFLAGHADPALAEEAAAALREGGFDPNGGIGAATVLRTAEPEVLNGVEPSEVPLFTRNPALLAVYRRTGTRHVLTVPLFARGEPLGAITLTSSRREGGFGPEDVAMVEDLARLAVAAIDTGRLYRRSQQSLRLRDEFLSIASHELRTPLTSLGLQSESLRAQAGRAPPEVVVRKADAIRRNVERLAKLVSTMLDLSRITAGRLDLEPERVELGELAREVAARFEDEAARAGSPIRVQVDERITGRWDRLRLDQVLTNLVSNALKYGAGKPVDVHVLARGPRAAVRVRDHGIGIHPADQERIFERFERAVSERNYGGFGLGLWITRRIVDAIGGTIAVESAPGEGATFTVELDREPPRDDRRPHGEPRAPA